MLTLEHIDHWHQHGWAAVDCLLSDAVRTAMPVWATGSSARSSGHAPHDPLERDAVRQFLDSSIMLGAAGELLEHKAILSRGHVRCARWSEGQRPRRLAGSAAPNRRAVVSVIPLGDDGLALELASHGRHRPLAADAAGLLEAGVAAGLDWRAVHVQPGEVLWLHPLVPIRVPRTVGVSSVGARESSVLLAAFSGRLSARDADPEDPTLGVSPDRVLA